MKKTWFAMAAVPALSVPLLWAQDSNTNKADGAHARKGALERVATPRGQSRARFDDDRDVWHGKLTVADLDRRERDFEELLDAARNSEQGLRALEQWAADGNSDFAWTCRLALKQLEHDRRAPGRAGSFGGPRWNDLQSRFDDLQRQFGGMDSMFGDLQRQLDEMSRATPRGQRVSPQGGQGQPQIKRFSLEVGPAGVTCTTTENVDGKEQKRTYTADNLEELLAAHPELREQVRPGGGLRFQLGPQADGFGGWFNPDDAGGAQRFHPFVNDDDRAAAPNAAHAPGQPRTDVLGVQVSKPTPDAARAMGLEPELGLQVESAVPGTIAHILGVKRGDLLVELNGTPLYGVDDVANVLRARAPEAELVVVLIDAKGQRRSLTWKPAADAPAPSAPSAADNPAAKSKPSAGSDSARRKF